MPGMPEKGKQFLRIKAGLHAKRAQQDDTAAWALGGSTQAKMRSRNSGMKAPLRNYFLLGVELALERTRDAHPLVASDDPGRRHFRSIG